MQRKWEWRRKENESRKVDGGCHEGAWQPGGKVKEEKLSIVMACASDDGENLCMSLKIMGDVANIADMLNSALIAHIKEAGVPLEDAVDGLRKCWRAMNEAEG